MAERRAGECAYRQLLALGKIATREVRCFVPARASFRQDIEFECTCRHEGRADVAEAIDFLWSGEAVTITGALDTLVGV